jgi:hypothetical protein
MVPVAAVAVALLYAISTVRVSVKSVPAAVE